MSQSAVVRSLLILGCAALVPLVPFVIIGELPGEHWLQAHTGSDRAFAVTGSALLALDVLLPVPSSVIGALLGARLGFTVGTLAAFTGLCAGAYLGYLAGRLVPARAVRGRHGGVVPTPSAPTLALVVLSRPVPVLAEAVAIAAGATRMSPRRYALAVAAGNGVYAVALAGNGAALLPDALAGPGLVLPMALPVVSWLFWRWTLSRRGQ